MLTTLDRQLSSINGVVDEITDRVTSAEEELVRRRATLQRRLVDIYKRGPLYPAEAMLTAHSFGELVARYKYLHEIAVHDRALVRRMETLRDDIVRQRTELREAARRGGGEPRRQGAGGGAPREPQAARGRRACGRRSAPRSRSRTGSRRSGSRRRGWAA